MIQHSRPGSRIAVAACLALATTAYAGSPAEIETQLDGQVRAFLDAHADEWHDMNVPEVDGKLLHDVILEHGYKNALEIGTSTGHSSIWIAWALSKTGGRLITIEIDESRHRQAVANFAAAGLSDFIDARLTDAHELVRQLEGPFDFVFCDADKDWYVNYFEALSSKLSDDACFAAHNAKMRERAIRDYLDHVKSLPGYETEIDESSRAGMAFTFKKSKK